MKKDGKWHCSFCWASEDKAALIIAGPDDVGICDRCVLICGNVMVGKLVMVQSVMKANFKVDAET